MSRLASKHHFNVFMQRAFALRSFAVALAAAAEPVAAPCRDRWQQPFSSTSIWNSAIGSGASFVPAQIYTGAFNYSYGCSLRVSAANRRVGCKAPGTDGKTPEAECIAAGCCFVSNPRPQCFIPAGGVPDAGIHADQDVLVRASPADPPTPFLDRAWRGGAECVEGGAARGSVPFPADFMVDCEDNNNAFALLLADNVTLLQSQPLYRAAPGRPIMAQYPPTSPYTGFLAGWNISILGEGAAGAHGGSFLSSIGGVIRAGELSAGLIPHALKLEVYGHDYYWSGLYGPPACFAWPALDCDGYGNSTGGFNSYAGLVPAVRPGALLAVPSALAGPLAANLSTAPARTILAALVAYGGYLVDDTAGDSAAVCAEPAAIAELRDVFGISINITSPALEKSPGATGAFFRDIVAIFQNLHAVTNNAPGNVGGGGAPLAPPAPPICGA